jgi:hypothetical protein
MLAREEESIAIVKKCPMHFYSFSFYLLFENHRRMKEYVFKKSFAKKESQRSTDFSLRKEPNVISNYSNILKEKEQLNESHEFNRLSKCLKNVLKKHDKGKNYKIFL